MSRGHLGGIEPAPRLITHHTSPKSPCLDDTFSKRHPCDVAACMAATDHPSCGVAHRREKAERLGLAAPDEPAPKPCRRAYTAEEARRALELHGRGKAWPVVGAEIGRSTAAVYKLVAWYLEREGVGA